MGALTMSREEREAFLADIHIGVLTVARRNGPPLATPVWYRYEPGGDIEVTTESGTVKAALLMEARQATLCVQREDFPYAYVSVEGTIATAEATRDVRTDIAVRYLGEEIGAGYVDSAPHSDDLLVKLTPQHWRTSDFAKLQQ